MRKTIVTIPFLLLFSMSVFAQEEATDFIEDGAGGDFKLEELGQTAAEFVLHIQQLGFIKASVKFIENSNFDLVKAYSDINKLKNSNFELHKYFKDEVLHLVKDEVKNHSKLLQTLDILKDIQREAKAAKDQVEKLDVFTTAEKEFFTESYSNILKDAGNIALEIAGIVTNEELGMNDAERIRMVYILYDSSEALLGGLRQFNNQLRLAANLRLENSDDYRNVQNLFELD
jgi:hypothetical protein